MASIRGPRRTVLQAGNRELWGGLEAEAREVGFTDLLSVKKRQRPLAERDFRSGSAGIPYKTGRLRRSLEFRPTAAGVSVSSDLRYYFQADDAVRNWWLRTGKARFNRAVHAAIREEQVKAEQRNRRRRSGAGDDELAAISSGNRGEERRLRRNRLARKNRRRSPQERAERARRRTKNAAFRRAEVRREVVAARGKRQTRIATTQSRFRARHNRRRYIAPRYRQAEFAVTQRALRTGRGRNRPGGGRAQARARGLLRLYNVARQSGLAAAGG